MYIYVKDHYGRYLVILNKDGKETELHEFKPTGNKPSETEKSLLFKEALEKAKKIAEVMGCDVALHELTMKECESAIMENRVTKHHAVFLLKKAKEYEKHTCPSCHRCGDRS